MKSQCAARYAALLAAVACVASLTGCGRTARDARRIHQFSQDLEKHADKIQDQARQSATPDPPAPGD